MSSTDAFLRVRRRKRGRTVFEIHHWPRREPTFGHVCSCRCTHDATRLLSDAWGKEDQAALKKRLGKNGQANGRVLYVVSRPPLSSGQSIQRDAAGLVSNRPQNAVQLYRVCMREDLVRPDQARAFFWLATATHRLGQAIDKPAQIYLGPDMEAGRIENRLRAFKKAPENRLSRPQRRMAGVWLEREP